MVQVNASLAKQTGNKKSFITERSSKSMKRKLFSLLFTFLLIIPLQVSAGKFGDGDDPAGNPGEWYTGMEPTEIDATKTPILFIHGLNGSSLGWWEENDMYDIALENGYETAFIDLYPTKNMWDNGALLAEKLPDIVENFGKKVTIVAHSKGGINAQSAIVHYDAHPFVDKVITLSTPHHGSQLADLAYSKWAGWLANILGSKNDGTYSLQTGYMQHFRKQTDQLNNRLHVPFYSFAGTSWGAFGGSLYWGGLYLRSFGQNDGAVTVTNSRLPYGTEIKVDKWDHFSIKLGSSTFSLFEPFLRVNGNTNSFAHDTISKQAMKETVASYLHGGQYKEQKKELFAVEENVKQIDVQWISNKDTTDLTLISPSGKKYTNFNVQKDTSNIFNQAYQYSFALQSPEAGEWTLQAEQKEESYLFNVVYDSDINNDLHLTTNNSQSPKMILMNDGNIATFQTDIKILKVEPTDSKEQQLKNTNEQTISLDHLQEGLYNITIDINGKTKNGHSFNRTIVQSFYKDKYGNLY